MCFAVKGAEYMDDTLTMIFSLIKKQKKKQTELARCLGIKPQTITDWKSGKNKSYINYIKQIAEFLNVSTDRLLGIEPQKSTPIKQDRSAVIDRINALPDDQFEKLAAKAEGYLDGLEDQ